jgi:ribonuclease E
MMKKEMLINVLQPEECRIAIVEDGVLEELYVERTSQESYVGNIYKGRIVNIEPSIQAAFVDFGIGRNGFLHVSDVDPAYYKHLDQGRSDRRGDRRDRGDRGDRGDRRDRGNGRGRREYSPPVETAPPPQELTSFLPESIPEIPVVSEPPPAEASDPASVWGAALEILGLDLPPAQQPAIEHEPADIPSEEPAPIMPPEAVTAAVEEPLPAEEANLDSAITEVDRDEPRRGRNRGRDRGNRRDRSNDKGRNRRNRRDEAETKEESSAPPEPTNEPVFDDKPAVMPAAERHTMEPAEMPFGAGILEPEPPALPHADFPEPIFDDKPEMDDSPADAVEFLDPISDGANGNGAVPHAIEESLTPEIDSEPVPVPLEGEIIEDDLPDDILAEDDEEEFDLEMELEDGEVPQPRIRPRERRRGGDRGDRGGRGGRGGPRRTGGRPGFGRPKPLIQDIFKRGQEVIIQVIKEGIGTKGPTLSTYISIAGRYLVLMPGLNRIGVSRKIMDEEARIRLREILTDLKPPKGLGFIIRTAGIDRNKKELQNDLAYLLRLWQVMVRRIRKMKSPAEIYQESDMITRTIRDVFTNDIDTIWVDEPNAFAHAEEFLQIVMPRYAQRIKHYGQTEPLFHKYHIEEEITRIQQKKLPLQMGGSIVIEQTEALVAIDVNSGNFRADNNAEETAYQMNLQAAKEIARQLRLRDLGGVIVNDFIDMRDEKHKRGVEKAMRDALKRDRARTKILRISQFGLIEMTRQRIRPSLKRSVYQECPMCSGSGQVKTVESVSIEVMRLLQLAAHREGTQRIQVRVHPEVGYYLLNRKRKDILHLEENGQMQISVFGQPGVAPEHMEITGYDRNGNELKLPSQEPPARPPERSFRGRR